MLMSWFESQGRFDLEIGVVNRENSLPIESILHVGFCDLLSVHYFHPQSDQRCVRAYHWEGATGVIAFALAESLFPYSHSQTSKDN
ncbi:hypothetical protein NLI96_g7444 [Meripilus lineatus]|uniref:Uncharacterized protein n=1 Tax=Meripilus lineatus TaxID=2056292 RepID=A0AAD5YC31_9APHY|nr:hypothetical protein NLI96_g7444 [Physisporinus lineatus]